MAKNLNSTNVDSGNWNNAKRYSDSKIMGLLESIDKYETISQLGFSSPEEHMNNSNMSEDEISYLKFHAFKYLVSKLIQLINNSYFAIINKKADAESCLKKLVIVENVFIPEIEKDVLDKQLSLPKYYSVILDVVQNIKAKINTPLNKNNLIFMGNRVDYDPMEAKRLIFEEAGAIPE